MRAERKSSRVVLIPVFLAILAGCGSERKREEIPGANIVGIRASITKILISPLAFDGAIVAVEGLAHDVKEKTLDKQQTVTRFKLSDLRGNSIDVSIPGVWEIRENDYLVVGGTYRRVKNEIEGQQIEKIQLEEKKKY